MRFQPDDIVICDEHPKQAGRVVKVRVAAGLVRVRWTPHTVSWHCEESLQLATMPAPAARTARKMQEVSR